jgi:hypothetical protein
MRFAIRDDDTCYFTSPGELEAVYSRLWPSAPVSLAVTPNAVESFFPGDPDRFHQGEFPRPLAENRELCGWLRSKVEAGRISVLLHGHTHEYRRGEAGRLVPECLWKSPGRLASETRLGRQQIFEALGVLPSVFVPPGNAMSRAAVRAVAASVPRILAAVPLRQPSFSAAWARRAWHQVRSGGPNPRPEWYEGAWLHPCYPLTGQVSFARLREQFLRCQRRGADFVVSVHYWELRGGILENLYRIADFALSRGARPALCEEVFPPCGGPAALPSGRRIRNEAV